MTNVFQENSTQNSNRHRSQKVTVFYYDKNLESKTDQIIRIMIETEFYQFLSKKKNNDKVDVLNKRSNYFEKNKTINETILK